MYNRTPEQRYEQWLRDNFFKPGGDNYCKCIIPERIKKQITMIGEFGISSYEAMINLKKNITKIQNQKFEDMETKLKNKTLKDRLKLYWDMLRDYRTMERDPLRTLHNGFLFKAFSANSFGFCRYLKLKYDIREIKIERELPELFSAYGELYEFESASVTGFWFCPDEISPRIKCLERAIIITKFKLREQMRKEKLLNRLEVKPKKPNRFIFKTTNVDVVWSEHRLNENPKTKIEIEIDWVKYDKEGMFDPRELELEQIIYEKLKKIKLK